MGLRHKSIRLRVLLLVLIPVLSLAGVYAYAATVTVSASVSLSRAKTVKDVTALPTGLLQTQLDAERRLAVLYLASPTAHALALLNQQETRTNRALAAFKGANMSGAITTDASAPEKAATAALVSAASGLTELRTRITSATISRSQVLNQYSAMVTAGYRVLERAIQQDSSVAVVNAGLNLIKLDEADQIALEESDLFTSDLVARSFPTSDRIEFTQLVAERRFLLADTLPQLGPAYRALYDKHVSSQSATALVLLENTIIRAPEVHGVPPVQALPWSATVGAYSTGLGKALTESSDVVTSRAEAEAHTAYLRLILAGGLGLLAIVISLLFSFFVGRGLIRQLAELRDSALELANDRLPSVMRRLRAGESVDVSAETPPVESSADEIDQVRQAFNIAARTAIEAAVDEAQLRRGVSDVFRNLARRSQVLLHRQLRLLDGMERRATEPEELEDLFRIDHLTTRMRRHAEGLIILSGESPGRGWRQPIPLVDVLRAAVAEVEDYQRIRVQVRTRAAVAGPAVADVIHLVAELAENATVFSPPNTPVRIQGDIAGRGFVVEIEDRGLGITEERRAEINRNLSDPPVFDLSGSDRLGLFIAGRLARRHDIQITLRPSPFGGTTAIVLIPLALVVDEDSYERVPAIGPDGRGLPIGGRHSLLDAARAQERAPVTPAPALPPATMPPGTASPATGSAGAGSAGATPSGTVPAGTVPAGTVPAGTVPAGTVPADTVPAGTVPADTVPASDAGQLPAEWAVSWMPGGSAHGGQLASSGAAGGSTSRNGSGFNGSAASDLTGSGSAGVGRNGRRQAGASGHAPAPRAGGENGLPVRVRQASLAPQLRDSVPPRMSWSTTGDEPDNPAAASSRAAETSAAGPARPGSGTAADTGSAAPATADAGSASPAAGMTASGAGSPQDAAEAARATMAALQRGWEAGRSGASGPPSPASQPPVQVETVVLDVRPVATSTVPASTVPASTGGDDSGGSRDGTDQ